MDRSGIRRPARQCSTVCQKVVIPRAPSGLAALLAAIHNGQDPQVQLRELIECSAPQTAKLESNSLYVYSLKSLFVPEAKNHSTIIPPCVFPLAARFAARDEACGP